MFSVVKNYLMLLFFASARESLFISRFLYVVLAIGGEAKCYHVLNKLKKSYLTFYISFLDALDVNSKSSLIKLYTTHAYLFPIVVCRGVIHIQLSCIQLIH